MRMLSPRIPIGPSVGISLLAFYVAQKLCVSSPATLCPRELNLL